MQTQETALRLTPDTYNSNQTGNDVEDCVNKD